MTISAASNLFVCQPGDIVLGQRPSNGGMIALVIGSPLKLPGQFKAWVGGCETDCGALTIRRLATFWFGGQAAEGRDGGADLGVAITDCRKVEAGELVEREGLTWLSPAARDGIARARASEAGTKSGFLSQQNRQLDMWE